MRESSRDRIEESSAGCFCRFGSPPGGCGRVTAAGGSASRLRIIEAGELRSTLLPTDRANATRVARDGYNGCEDGRDATDDRTNGWPITELVTPPQLVRSEPHRYVDTRSHRPFFAARSCVGISGKTALDAPPPCAFPGSNHRRSLEQRGLFRSTAMDHPRARHPLRIASRYRRPQSSPGSPAIRSLHFPLCPTGHRGAKSGHRCPQRSARDPRNRNDFLGNARSAGNNRRRGPHRSTPHRRQRALERWPRLQRVIDPRRRSTGAPAIGSVQEEPNASIHNSQKTILHLCIRKIHLADEPTSVARHRIGRSEVGRRRTGVRHQRKGAKTCVESLAMSASKTHAPFF